MESFWRIKKYGDKIIKDFENTIEDFKRKLFDEEDLDEGIKKNSLRSCIELR